MCVLGRKKRCCKGTAPSMTVSTRVEIMTSTSPANTLPQENVTSGLTATPPTVGPTVDINHC